MISKYVILNAQQKQQTRTYTHARAITRENDKPHFSLEFTSHIYLHSRDINKCA